MSLATITTRVDKKIEANQCKLPCDDSEKRKYHLRAQEVIKRLLNQGGLGLRSVMKMNQALQMMWTWRFIKEMGISWRAIKAKFGMMGRGRYSGHVGTCCEKRYTWGT